MDASFSFINSNPKSQEFLANGSWVCPVGVTSVILMGTGGGGGGGTSGTDVGGCGGGCGEYGTRVVTVTPGVSYSIIIGAGGALNTDGAATTFGGTLGVFAGGPAGQAQGAGIGGMRGSTGAYGISPKASNAPANSGAGGNGEGVNTGPVRSGGSGRLIVCWFDPENV